MVDPTLVHILSNPALHAAVIRHVVRLNDLWMQLSYSREVALTAMAIKLGELEGSPMSMGRLCSTLHMARASVSRHVNLLVERGYATHTKQGRRSVLKLTEVGASDPDLTKGVEFYDGVIQSIEEAYKEVSKMDT